MLIKIKKKEGKNILELNTTHNMDCKEGMKLLDENSIATCITDPPYDYEFIGKDWNDDEIKRRVERIQDSSTLVKNIPYGSGLAGGKRNVRWYKRNRENTLAYEKWTENWGKELYRVMKPGGLVFVFNSTRSIAHVQIALENVGFYARDIIVWRRHSGIPKGINMELKLEKLGDENSALWKGWHSCLRNEWESICVVQKPLLNNYIETIREYNVGLFNAKSEDGFQSNIIENITRDKKDEFNEHVTVKPKELIKKLIKLSVPNIKGNIVLDNFMGSGTLAVCIEELKQEENYKIDYIGFETNKEYIEDIIKPRIRNIAMKG